MPGATDGADPPLGPFFAGFAHHGLWLVVEVVGDQHASAEGLHNHSGRTAYPEGVGYRVHRFWSDAMWENLEGVVETILASAAVSPPTPVRGKGAALPSAPQAGGGESVAR